eukprot:CAMPEP_0167744340 /NCGR_PEP_ID=MMETSP0110_2-20121227/2534_1 /TAXON_ID=629695 /ORGANISM="Gymnochlora sp., Strain CCMP2014" /LENGTH=161 /DNA_ID=CAMNT_0007628845 /DNA_START=719 /DNA_END=1200 /DNA_ORIENTATION=+
MEPQRMSYETGVTISTVSEEDKAFAVSGTEANVFSRLHNIYSAQAIDDIALRKILDTPTFLTGKHISSANHGREDVKEQKGGRKIKSRIKDVIQPENGPLNMVEAEKKKENNQKMHEDSLESKDDSKTMNGPVKKVAKGNALTDTPTEDKDFVAVQVDELW